MKKEKMFVWSKHMSFPNENIKPNWVNIANCFAREFWFFGNLREKKKKMSCKLFLNEKTQTLKKFDRSTKGSIDLPIVDLVDAFNCSKHFYTTSSCSGRLIIFGQHTKSEQISAVKSKGIDWTIVTHNPVIDSTVFIEQIETNRNDPLYEQTNFVTLKFEPFILHVCCESKLFAMKLMNIAVDCGFRNSGMSIRNTGRIIVAIRCTMGLEVPLMIDGVWCVDDRYLRLLINVANEKFERNLKMIETFQNAINTLIDV